MLWPHPFIGPIWVSADLEVMVKPIQKQVLEDKLSYPGGRISLPGHFPLQSALNTTQLGKEKDAQGRSLAYRINKWEAKNLMRRAPEDAQTLTDLAVQGGIATCKKRVRAKGCSRTISLFTPEAKAYLIKVRERELVEILKGAQPGWEWIVGDHQLPQTQLNFKGQKFVLTLNLEEGHLKLSHRYRPSGGNRILALPLDLQDLSNGATFQQPVTQERIQGVLQDLQKLMPHFFDLFQDADLRRLGEITWHSWESKYFTLPLHQEDEDPAIWTLKWRSDAADTFFEVFATKVKIDSEGGVSPMPLPWTTAEGRLKQAEYHIYSTGSAKPALRALDRGIQADPSYMPNHSYKAWIYTELKDYEKALAAYDAGMAQDGSHLEFYIQKAWVLCLLKRSHEAAENLAIAEGLLNWDDPKELRYFARHYQKLAQTEASYFSQGERFLKKWFDKDPIASHDSYRDYLIWTNASELLLDLFNKKSIPALQAAIEAPGTTEQRRLKAYGDLYECYLSLIPPFGHYEEYLENARAFTERRIAIETNPELVEEMKYIFAESKEGQRKGPRFVEFVNWANGWRSDSPGILYNVN